MKLNYIPRIFYYSNQDTQDRYAIDNYDRIYRELSDSEERLRKLKESKYQEIADKVNFDIQELNSLKFNQGNYGKMFQEVFSLMKDRGFTKKEFEEIGSKYGLNLSYLFPPE